MLGQRFHNMLGVKEEHIFASKSSEKTLNEDSYAMICYAAGMI